MVKIQITKLRESQFNTIPIYATAGSAGMDLVACIDNDIIILPLNRVLVPTGIAIELPQGFEAQVRPRSGLALKNGVTVLNTPGTIDSDYRGEIGVILVNLASENFTITPGMRIAQMVIAEYSRAEFEFVSKLSDSDRGAGGFGSTGVTS